MSFISYQAEQLDVKLQKLKQILASGTETVPYSVRSEQLLEIDSLGKRLKESARGCLRYGTSFQNIVIKPLQLILFLFIGPYCLLGC